ncbi:MAG: 50S ribosomal protein L35 [Candidatus Muirbacterium halophilum]|nr:50S ribosomal protein L35 [Candidatus Muirbacterium halophilum]MCK9476446.1 50S ribosomal protein L35 [Candidatus Muirbacterium halophilum]
MPKLKSRRAACKRFKVTGSGKIMRMKEGASHILTKKGKKRKRNLRKAVVVTSKSVEKNLKRMLLAE